MDKTIENANIAILTCPFECPKPKTKYEVCSIINVFILTFYKNIYINYKIFTSFTFKIFISNINLQLLHLLIITYQYYIYIIIFLSSTY